jgi:hypothetical protein
MLVFAAPKAKPHTLAPEYVEPLEPPLEPHAVARLISTTSVALITIAAAFSMNPTATPTTHAADFEFPLAAATLSACATTAVILDM